METLDARTLAERYIALWVEPDEQVRRAEIRALWAADGAHVLLTRRNWSRRRPGSASTG
ncbi:hypothetical protein [Amycolatopsis tolypomycina]|uniref:SnoaL-like domain-containing protein n=1 Tax=Amycolatopsis tolypomycina TaxID=208445 RepID=A0A1H4IE69_9PSEU|nr:hypothetical protein [Amycolatopsis tolypomycina]SEB31986.1 hypothetical protein SAMN04489727_0369 [Amycolatopsis tolypomycina]